MHATPLLPGLSPIAGKSLTATFDAGRLSSDGGEESERLLLEFAEREQIVVVTEKSSIAENYLAAANAVKAIQGFRTGASADRRNAR